MGQGKLPQVIGFSDTLFEKWPEEMYEKLARIFELNFHVRYELGDEALANQLYLKDFGYGSKERITTHYGESGMYYEFFKKIKIANGEERFELFIYPSKAVKIGGYYHTQVWRFLIDDLKYPLARKGYFDLYAGMKKLNILFRNLMLGIDCYNLLIYGDYYDLEKLESILLGELELRSFDDILKAAADDGVEVFDLDEIIYESQSNIVHLNKRFMDCPQEKIAFILRR